MERREQAAGAWAPLERDALRRRWRTTTVVDGPWAGARRASLWTLSQVVAAALDLHALHLIETRLVERLLRGRADHRRGAAYAATARGSERYYDDNAWLALDLVQAAAPLDEARRLLRFLHGGTVDGGVLWLEHGSGSRHTCSTAPTAELAFRLALLGDRDAADVGEAAMAFLARELRRPDGLYGDHVRADGTIEPTVWSYNQGTPAGAAALWSLLSGDDTVLGPARETADAALAHFGAADGLWRQPPAFNAVFLRNLLLLDAIAGYPPAEVVLHEYLDRCWDHARHRGTGWFTEGGIGRYDRGGSIDQAGLVQLFALAAWPRERRVEIC